MSILTKKQIEKTEMDYLERTTSQAGSIQNNQGEYFLFTPQLSAQQSLSQNKNYSTPK